MTAADVTQRSFKGDCYCGWTDVDDLHFKKANDRTYLTYKTYHQTKPLALYSSSVCAGFSTPAGNGRFANRWKYNKRASRHHTASRSCISSFFETAAWRSGSITPVSLFHFFRVCLTQSTPR